MTLELLAIGVISILGQVVLLRELSVSFFGVELVYVVALGGWMAGSAAGALSGRIAESRAFAAMPTPDGLPVPAVLARAKRDFYWILIGLGFLIPLSTTLIRCFRPMMGEIPGAFLPASVQLGGILAAVAPAGFGLGLLFHRAASAQGTQPGSLATAYAIECGGAVLGGIASTLMLQVGIQNFTAAVFCGLLCGLVPSLKAGSARLRIAGGLLLAGSLLAVWDAPSLDRRLTQVSHPSLLATSDSPYSRITITQWGEQYTIFENDVLRWDSGSTEAEELVHLAVNQLPRVEEVLVLGGGLEGLLTELLSYRPSRIDCVEMNPVLVALTRRFLPPHLQAPLDPDQVRLRIGDPRTFLSHAGEYDLILVSAADPESGQSNRFFSQEFFRLCSHHLKTEGIMGFRISSAENLGTILLRRRNGSVFKAVKKEFNDFVVLPGGHNIVLASNSRLERNPLVLADRFKRASLQLRLVSPQYIEYLYTNDRFADLATLAEQPDLAINRDLHPVCYRYSMLIWLSKLFPSLINLNEEAIPLGSTRTLARGILALLFVPSVLAFLWATPRIRDAIAMSFASFAGVALESLLLLHYQVKHGGLFQDIGLLLMLWMAGMTAGTWLVSRLRNRVRRLAGRRTNRILFAGLALLAGIYGGILASNLAAGFALIAFLLLADGALIGGIFAGYGGESLQEDRKRISPLYGADLLGGAVASIIAAVLLIPFLGFTETALLLALLTGAGALIF